jgi:hypothetical protein
MNTERQARRRARLPDEESQRLRGEKNVRRNTERRIDMPQQEVQIIRGQNTRRNAKRRAEMAPEQRIQAREISRGQQRAPRTRPAYSIGELEDFDEKSKPRKASTTSTVRNVPFFRSCQMERTNNKELLS